MMKVFISQPMHGLSKEEVMKTRNEAKKYLEGIFGEVEILQTYEYDDAPENAGRLWYLGRSIQKLGEADAIYFTKGYDKAKGCIIENIIAKLYNIHVISNSDYPGFGIIKKPKKLINTRYKITTRFTDIVKEKVNESENQKEIKQKIQD